MIYSAPVRPRHLPSGDRKPRIRIEKPEVLSPLFKPSFKEQTFRSVFTLKILLLLSYFFSLFSLGFIWNAYRMIEAGK